MKSLFSAVVIMLLYAAPIAQSAVSFDLIPAYGPNPNVALANSYAVNATSAMRNGATKVGDRSTSGYAYEQITGDVPSYTMLETGTQSAGYKSYWGVVLPSDKLSPTLNNQLGNNIFLGMHFHAGENDNMTLSGVSGYSLSITDTIGGAFSGQSTPLAGVTHYSQSIVGIRADGSMASDINEPVVDIYYVGPSNGFDAYNYGSNGQTDQEKLSGALAEVNSFGHWSFTATATLASVSQSQTVQVVPAVYTPEPALLSIIGASAFLLKRRYTRRA